jgi:magnesium-transporting ATPase (P-type)
MKVVTTLGIIIGILFIVSLLITAFGGLNPGRYRRYLDNIASFGAKLSIIYLVIMIVYGTFSGLSVERSIHSVLANIFAVVLAVLLSVVFLSDFFPEKENK